MTYHRDILKIDPAAVTEELAASLLRDVRQTLRRGGAVVGISGGIDSSVVLALCVRAFGPRQVLGVMMPEQDSSPDSVALARLLADQFGVETVLEDLTEALSGFDCYARRDEAIRRVFPHYGKGYKARITLPGNVLESDTLNVFSLTIISPDG
jgi:NAD+ synthase